MGWIPTQPKHELWAVPGIPTTLPYLSAQPAHHHHHRLAVTRQTHAHLHLRIAGTGARRSGRRARSAVPLPCGRFASRHHHPHGKRGHRNGRPAGSRHPSSARAARALPAERRETSTCSSLARTRSARARRKKGTGRPDHDSNRVTPADSQLSGLRPAVPTILGWLAAPICRSICATAGAEIIQISPLMTK
jgi:hypothetical protein